ncbi:YrzI family small protein [Mesobacillus maritimus]|nr:YrzI family small protein [Mesobacillus maritimus]MCM3588845.1 YrzI family small protein [Mesobacillus maritimus]MCM3669981.1 YrzI family small protein [Mesobacillus maritimus]
MTLNILFLTITLKKRITTLEEVMHDQQVEMFYEETKQKINSYLNQY